MCGHVGIAGKLEYKDEATVKKLLLFDYFRGPDSTGLAAVRHNKDVHMAKIASHPIDLFDSQRFKTALSGANSKAFIGHNRLATKGSVNAVNAHPYQYGHIIGAHNGTLKHSSWAALEDATNEKTAVDSQAIFRAIEVLGIDATVALMEEGKQSHEGAWALVWYDLKENTLNFLRNQHRSFWYAYSKEFNKVIWASEWWTMEAATRGTYDLFTTPEGFRFFTTKEDWLYSWDLDKLSDGSEERPKPRVREIKGKEPAPVSSYGGYDPFPQRGTTGTGTYHGNNRSNVVPINNNSTLDVKHFIGNVGSPMAGVLTKPEFDEIAKYGCSWCSTDVEYDEPGVAVYPDRQMVLCPTCSGHESQTRIYVEDVKKTLAL